MTITVTPEMLMAASQHISGRIDEAEHIAKSYLATIENAIGPQTYSGAGSDASHQVATQVSADLAKTLTGGRSLANGLMKAAQIMASGDAEDDQHYRALFGGDGAGTVSV